jgi:hypothetical protein
VNKSKQEQIDSEKITLFNFLWAALEKEKDEIKKEFGLARNLACTEWQFSYLNGELLPVKTIPQRTDLLDKNFNLMIETNSRRKYFLIEVFLPILENLMAGLDEEQTAVYQYWKQELVKENPELEDRFA